MFRIGSVVHLFLALALVAACSRESASPVSPSGAEQASAEATAPGGLKATAPTPQSPTNGQKPSGSLVLVAGSSRLTYSPVEVPLSYEFEILTPAGARVYLSPLVDGVGPTVSHSPNASLTTDQPYNWRVRPVYNGARGPWSTNAAFVANRPAGYIQGNELYDPLTNGTTVGTVHGPVEFIPGVGAKMLSDHSYIEYELPQTLTEGEYSAILTNLTVISGTEDPKWRVISMREGQFQINDNIYRMTVDKRGNGAIAWRFISGDNGGGEYIETQGAERRTHRFQDHLTYLVRATWRGQFFRVQYEEEGRMVYDFGKPYGGIYQPLPHMVYAGSPFKAGDRGEPSTVEGMIIRQIWVSPNPRPAFANE
jgi:hypothetical protein